MSLSDTQVQKIAEACLALGGDVVDDQGFVSVRSLLARFDADLVLRPMLVEAMLCKASDAGVDTSSSSRSRWRLMVDSETYSLSHSAIEEEGGNSTLPVRFRNTVAHELTHSLAFRAKEFGIELTIPAKAPKEKPADFVAAIERCTEQMSPLLLMPDAAIEHWFPANLSSLSIDHLTKFRRAVGVSRHILVQRLNLLAVFGNHLFINRRCFADVAVGVGTWTRDGVPMLNAWPLFLKFERNEWPAFIHALRRAKSMATPSIVTDTAFVLNGGRETSVRIETTAGTEKNLARSEVSIELSVELTQPHSGATFLFLARRLPLAGP